MRALIGIIIILASLTLGAYVGLYQGIYTVIIDLIEVVKADEIEASKVALAIIKFIVLPAVGSTIAYTGSLAGLLTFK